MLKFLCSMNYSTKIKYKPVQENVSKILVVRTFMLGCRSMKDKDDSLCKSTKPRVKTIRIYRYNPEEKTPKPYVQKFQVDLNTCGLMVLDLLSHIKATTEPSLSFRRSCREGICGNCSMNINGVNTLACITKIPKDLSKPLIIYPLPHTYVIRDLVSDMSQFLNQYKLIEPFLKRPGEEEFVGTRSLLQSKRDRDKLNGLYECILCACCTYSCPPYYWTGEKFLGPAVLMQVYRWMIDSRDLTETERISKVRDFFSVFRCKTVYNCTKTCPKGLNPAKAIAELKGLVTGCRSKEKPDFDTKIPNTCCTEISNAVSSKCS